MAQETIDDIIKRKQQEKAAAEAPAPASDAVQEDKFFSILVGDGVQEHFLELRNRDGLSTCFPYNSIMWMVYDPEGQIHIDFTGFSIFIEGRGLAGKLYDGLKQKRVAWIKESDVELQDHNGNETFISKITITPPEGFPEPESEETPA